MPVGPILLRNMAVTAHDASEFMAAFSEALDTLQQKPVHNLYLFPKDRHALAISLDAELRPFLGFTSGFNLRSDRAYLRGHMRIIDEIAGVLVTLDKEIQGGRVFLSEYSASKIIDGVVHTLCTYEWPGEGPYSAGRRIYEARLALLSG